jgi:hypothetical protein
VATDAGGETDLPAQPSAPAVPSTVVHVAFGLLVAAAVLGPYYDRRALLAVAAAVVFIDLDAVTSLLLESTHRALFTHRPDTAVRRDLPLRGDAAERAVVAP